MNLLEESVKAQENEKSKKAPKILLDAIILVVLIIISIFIYLLYIKSNILHLYLDGKINNELKSLLVFEDDGTIYVTSHIVDDNPVSQIRGYRFREKDLIIK